MNSEQLAAMRQAYGNQEFTLSSSDSNPFHQFTKWFKEAIDAQLMEPNAMTLSTATADGKPSGRIVLLKGLENESFVFFTNYNSRKGKEIEENPKVALTFWWDGLQRQVRIDGTIEKIAPEASTAYFQSRPKGSQIGAWASPQSDQITSRDQLTERVVELTEKYATDEVLPRPEHWGGYAVTADEIEFWQGRANRLHDRILYLKENKRWVKIRLAP
ncbi:MAG: pyridoxamine 5'-phosphate oxidase [Saprospiraceae bacterium]|nr:pyridoxamine 5'-phosphate oxidase [Saprospiraceae bacterium]